MYIKSYYSEKIKKRQNGEARIFQSSDEKRTKSKRGVPLAKEGHTFVENIQILSIFMRGLTQFILLRVGMSAGCL